MELPTRIPKALISALAKREGFSDLPAAFYNWLDALSATPETSWFSVPWRKVEEEDTKSAETAVIASELAIEQRIRDRRIIDVALDENDANHDDEVEWSDEG